MHIKLPDKIESRLRYWRRKLLPRTLFFRTMLLIFVPLIAAQVVSVVVFFDGSWSRMGRRLSENLVDEMQLAVSLNEKFADDKNIKEIINKNLDFEVDIYDIALAGKIKQRIKANPILITYLIEEMKAKFKDIKWEIYTAENEEHKSNNLIIFVEKGKYLYKFEFSKKRVFSSSIFMFVVWMVVTSMLLFLVSVLFLRIQVRAIADLAQTAENFGKGISDDGFKPYGSSEVRKAGNAFIKMKERIFKQIMERTLMLAGISHDLRTPLTRMKLMVTMMENSQDKEDFLADINEMQKMLDGYLSFVRGEGDEKQVWVNLSKLIQEIIERLNSKKVKIKFDKKADFGEILVKEQALKRAITNIVANAMRYGKKIEVNLEKNNKKVKIFVDDDGPGIPKSKRKEVFRAFYRLENSRNKETGGIGLGLAITKDIINSHGGKIYLEDGPLGGLRVIIELPM